jgi:hypothetical protein
MTESNVNKAQRELAEAQKWQTYINTIKDGAETVVEQGLWVTLSFDMFAISRKIYEKEDHFLYKQRYELITLLKALTDKSIEGGPVKLPNPGYYMFRMLRPLTGEMEKHGRDEKGLYYEAMDPIPSMILAFTVPGVIRLLSSQIGDIIPF